MKTILIKCTGKFCYRQGNFRNTEAATGGALNFTEIKIHKIHWKTPMPVSFSVKLQAKPFFKCEIFKTPFLQATVSQNMKACNRWTNNMPWLGVFSEELIP